MSYPYKEWMSRHGLYQATYWSGKGKYQAEFDKLHAELVPGMGDAATVEGQMLCYAANFYYDRYNNGHCNPGRTREGALVDHYMKRNGLKGRFIVNQFNDDLDAAMDELVLHILSRPYFKKRRIKK